MSTLISIVCVQWRLLNLSLCLSSQPDADSREEEGERDFGPLTVPYPPLKKEMEAKSRKAQEEKKQKEKPQNEPEYTIVHRGEMSMQDFTNERSSSRIKRPKELVVTVHLPGVKSAKTVELDIFEKSLQLHCPKPLYKLDVSLSVVYLIWVLRYTVRCLASVGNSS